MNPSVPHARFEGTTALLSLEGLRVLDLEALRALEHALAELRVRRGLCRLVIHNPAPDFMVGVDTTWILACMEADDFTAIRRFVERGQAWLRAIEALPLTIVIAVDGFATGAGAEWLAAADAVIATPSARIGLPETGIGIAPALGGTQRVPRRIGLGAARWMVLTGEYVGAEAALALGWIDRVVASNNLLEAALCTEPARPRASRIAFAPLVREPATLLQRAFAEEPLERLCNPGTRAPELERAAARLRRRAPIALRVADELLRATAHVPLAEGLAREIAALATVYATQDALTGIRASAAGRRAARFYGH